MPPPRARVELRARRRRITRTVVSGLAALGAVAYVPSVWAAVLVGAWSIVVLDTVVFAAVIYVFVRRDLDERVGAAVAVAVAAVLGVVLSVVFGPNSAGVLYLAAVPVLTALLFDRRATIWSLVFLTVALGVIAALRWADLLAWDVTPGGTLLWLVLSGNALVIAGGLGLAVTALIGGLTEAADRTERYGAALAREQAELLELNDRLERAITERSQAETRLRQSEKLTAIGTLASGIAHDMNNLLVPILTGAELLRAEADDGGERAEILDHTLEAARFARDLVDRILAFSRPSGEAAEPMDAGVVFRDAVRLLDAALPANVHVSFQADPDAGAVLLSNAEAHQIVLNLGTNGARAMPDGGPLTITVDSVAAGDEPADVPTPASGRFVRLAVTDAGTGMDDETLARIFEPFFTTWEHHGGAPGHGIGLATVYGIASRAGGYIVPHSAPDAGTVMEVFLPRTEAARARGTPEREPARSTGQRVLVVDDDEGVRVIARRALERAGYRPVVVDSAEAALRRIQDEDEPFDAVLTDLAMPGMDGLGLAAALRRSHPGLPVVLMSGLVDEEVGRRAEALEIEAVVSKPFGIRELTAAVAGALAYRPVPNGSD